MIEVEEDRDISQIAADKLWQCCLKGQKTDVRNLYYWMNEDPAIPRDQWWRSYLDTVVTDEGDRYLANKQECYPFPVAEASLRINWDQLKYRVSNWYRDETRRCFG